MYYKLVRLFILPGPPHPAELEPGQPFCLSHSLTAWRVKHPDLLHPIRPIGVRTVECRCLTKQRERVLYRQLLFAAVVYETRLLPRLAILSRRPLSRPRIPITKVYQTLCRDKPGSISATRRRRQNGRRRTRQILLLRHLRHRRPSAPALRRKTRPMTASSLCRSHS